MAVISTLCFNGGLKPELKIIEPQPLRGRVGVNIRPLFQWRLPTQVGHIYIYIWVWLSSYCCAGVGLCFQLPRCNCGTFVGGTLDLYGPRD